jgi:hypothetical protein
MQNLQDKRLNGPGRAQIALAPTMVFRATRFFNCLVRQTLSYVLFDPADRLDKITTNHGWGSREEEKVFHHNLQFFAGPQLFSCATKSLADSMVRDSTSNPRRD